MGSLLTASIVAISILWIAAWLVYRNKSERLVIYPGILMVRLPFSLEPKEGNKLSRRVAWLGVILLLISFALFYYYLFEIVYYRYFKPIPGSSKIGLAPLIPGVTVPWSILPYVLIALGIAALFHELSHAIVARIEGLRVKSAGLALFTFIPAAFVEIDEEELKKARISSRAKVYSAGVAANLILFLLFMTIILGGSSHLSNGIRVIGVEPQSPAYIAGIKKGDIIIEVNNVKINSIDDLRTVLIKVGVPNPNKAVHLTIKILRDGNIRSIDLYKPLGKDKIGITIVNNFNKLGYTVYFSEILNYALALINAAPLFITDGARILDDFLIYRFKKETGKTLSVGIQLATLLLVLSVITIAPIVPS